jgi:hypothetical protein
VIKNAQRFWSKSRTFQSSRSNQKLRVARLTFTESHTLKFTRLRDALSKALTFSQSTTGTMMMVSGMSI